MERSHQSIAVIGTSPSNPGSIQSAKSRSDERASLGPFIWHKQHSADLWIAGAAAPILLRSTGLGAWNVQLSQASRAQRQKPQALLRASGRRYAIMRVAPPHAEANSRYALLPAVLRATGIANPVHWHLGTVQVLRMWCSRLG